MQMVSDRNIFLSTLPASRTDRNVAWVVVGVSFVLFVVAVPFAGMPLTPVPAFVASYQAALAINDIITAVLLFSQFAILKSRGLLLLASGYLFTAAAATVHALSFPGLFATNGLLDGGPQTTVWIFMIWHGGFPLFVLAYALNKARDGGAKVQLPTMTAILASIAAVGVATLAYIWLVTSGHNFLPTLLSQARYTPVMMGVVSTVWCLSLAALLVMWFRRPHSVIDVWLMVVLCAWLFDIALSAIVNVARFDLGFYAGRLYGLCAASFVLAVLLVDNVALQAQMSRLVRSMRREAAFVRDQHKVRERLFSAVVESSSDAIITNALNGTITGWNLAAERVFGYSEQEAVGQHISLVVPPHRLDEIADLLRRVTKGERIDGFETVRVHKDGRNVDVSLSLSPLLSANGDIIGVSRIARDITESKQTQSALSREIEERQRIFETSQDLILVTDSVGNFVQVSPSVAHILGYEPEEMIGHSAVEFIHADDLESTRQEMRAARRGLQVRSFEARYPHKDGNIVTLNWMGSWSEPVRRHFFIGRDLTDKRAAEAQMRQAQKMDAIGQLTGGVAHDFNNILTVITGTIGILGEAVADRPELVSIAKLIDDAAERGAQLTKHLLAFARKQPLQPLEIDINSLILEAAKLLHPTLGEHIEISPKLSDDAWPTLVDPSQLTTAVLNLSLNARDAMPRGGKLTLETDNVHLDQDYASMNSE
ncbi:MAG TPA: PAS domain S-box protein, partial [Bradyrhizobium sp.]|nr:PAS domain S-box protein [Bradyrhizobium sp.]